jgi:hypothetical protein
MNHTTRLILRADAIFDLSFGALTFLAPWIRGLFDLLDLPNPQPEVYTQVGGGLLVVCAYLLWISPGDEALARPVTLSIGLVNAVGVILVAGWLIAGNLGVGTLGTLILAAACAILAVFSVVELRYALATRPRP